MAEQRKTDTAEFKVSAVKPITEEGYSVAEAARNPGVSEKQLRKWRHALAGQGEQGAFPGKAISPRPGVRSAGFRRRSAASAWRGTS